jgi:hypothetical protein
VPSEVNKVVAQEMRTVHVTLQEWRYGRIALNMLLKLSARCAELQASGAKDVPVTHPSVAKANVHFLYTVHILEQFTARLGVSRKLL